MSRLVTRGLGGGRLVLGGLVGSGTLGPQGGGGMHLITRGLGGGSLLLRGLGSAPSSPGSYAGSASLATSHALVGAGIAVPLGDMVGPIDHALAGSGVFVAWTAPSHGGPTATAKHRMAGKGTFHDPRVIYWFDAYMPTFMEFS